MRTIKLMIPSAILVAGFLASTTSVYGTSKYAKKEKQSCTYCHMATVSDKKEMVKNLNTTGSCYKDNKHSLAKCAPAK